MPWSIVRCLNIAALTFNPKKLRTVTFEILETFDSINSAIEQKLRDRMVEGRANATSSALRGSVLVNPSMQKVRTKFIKTNFPGNTINSGLILFRPIVPLFGSTNVCY